MFEQSRGYKSSFLHLVNTCSRLKLIERIIKQSLTLISKSIQSFKLCCKRRNVVDHWLKLTFHEVDMAISLAPHGRKKTEK